MKTFEEFKSALKSGELKAELEELAKTAKEKAVSEKEALICEFAKKLGYDVSVEDLAAERAAVKEMSKEELEAVAGGIGCESVDFHFYDCRQTASPLVCFISTTINW